MKVPAGKYYISDPCYLFNDDDWMCFCDHIDEEFFKIRGKCVCVFNTAHGDGLYKVKRHPTWEVPVDAGVIGLTPVDIITKEPWMNFPIVEFKEDTECFSEDGILHFGKYEINTN